MRNDPGGTERVAPTGVSYGIVVASSEEVLMMMLLSLKASTMTVVFPIPWRVLRTCVARPVSPGATGGV